MNPDEKHYLVIVADESRAIFYAHDTLSGPLRELDAMSNAAARMKTDELITDRGGRSFDSHGHGRHAMVGEKSGPHQHAAQAFAKGIAERIAGSIHNGSCRSYALVAAPRFLGLLRDAIATATRAEPYASIDKDIVGKDTAIIEGLLKDARTPRLG